MIKYRNIRELLSRLNYKCFTACDQGAVVAFLSEGQVGCFKEDRLVGEFRLNLKVPGVTRSYLILEFCFQ